MFEVLKGIECVMIGTNERLIDSNKINTNGRTTITGEMLDGKHEIFFTEGESKHNIALVGLRRDVHYYREGQKYASTVAAPKHGFNKLRCYSAYIINMQATYGRGIYFPQRPIMEDIEFQHECEEKKLHVIKAMRYFHRKVTFTKSEPVENSVIHVTGLKQWDEGIVYNGEDTNHDEDYQKVITLIEAHVSFFYKL
jgi:uncharacterized short protein YbdD (DUF466 family)